MGLKFSLYICHFLIGFLIVKPLKKKIQYPTQMKMIVRNRLNPLEKTYSINQATKELGIPFIAIK